jgi:hypothetical protein
MPRFIVRIVVARCACRNTNWRCADERNVAAYQKLSSIDPRKLQTEREMHNAWRKRAEEAEATPPQADETLPAGAKTPGEDAWLDEMIVCDTKDQLRTILRAYRANLLAQPSGAQGPELAEARLSIPAHHDDDDRLWLAAEEKRLAALVLSRVNHAWLASATPRPDLIAVSEKVWGVRFDGQMVCAPTIEEAVTVLRSGLAAKDKPPAAPLCGKRIPETGLGCTLEPGHQGRHDVDVTKVSEAPTPPAAPRFGALKAKRDYPQHWDVATCISAHLEEEGLVKIGLEGVRAQEIVRLWLAAQEKP